MPSDRELMQMALDALKNTDKKIVPGGLSTDDREKLNKTTKALRDRLAQPEPTGREIQKMMQSAWKAVRTEYKDDPECCFALGWEAGYGAVAPRVEPPETESGEGFESLPAPPPKQPEPEPAFYVIQATDRFGEGYEQTYWEDPNGFPVYTAPVHAIDISQERVNETAKYRHECPEWDFMEITEDDPEFEACLCFPKPDLWLAISQDGRVKYTTDSERAAAWKKSGSYRVVRDYYTAPPKREWVGLTHEERDEIDQSCRSQMQAIFAVEEKLKEKNT